MFMVLSSDHIARVHPVHSMTADWAPDGRQPFMFYICLKNIILLISTFTLLLSHCVPIVAVSLTF